MFHVYSRFTGVSLVLLAALLLLIHAQPYDDHGLRQEVSTEVCSLPCFMGIRPGLTTVDEAYQLLSNNVWVGDMSKQVLNDLYGTITWSWSVQKPAWIADHSKGQVLIRDRVVSTVVINTRLQLGDTRLLLGLPDTEIVDTKANANREGIYYFAFYPGQGLLIQKWLSCPIREPLRTSVILNLSQARPTLSRHVDELSDLFRAC
jgi:hypothetical protein